ncbi:tetratricopeptide repeat domain-containing protein [Xylariaceae sp. FL1651]|nr:tetratricopeptide repeat domain-containing protein [Xylariaceae sp. FL1651]
MADVFSIVTGAAGLLDVCVRLGSYIQEVKNEGTTIQQDLDSLLNEIVTLQQVHEAINHAYNKRISTPRGAFKSPSSHDLSPNATDTLWQALGRAIKHCHVIVERIYNILEEICQTSQSGFSRHVDTVKKVHRKRSREENLRRYRVELGMYHSSIQTFLTLINREDTQESFETIENQLHAIQSHISGFGESATSTGDDEEALLALRELKGSIMKAVEIISPPVINEYFYTPQSVSSIFTGREMLLQRLRDNFIQPSGPLRNQSQRRFVIHGLAGSGKTQFCCKFAEDNRDRFWGVFCVDASSEQSIKKSLGGIAKLAKRDPNANAALDWLSSVEQRWLLLIDNADDADLKLDDYFPKGVGGHILITTRNQGFRVLGNVEPRYYDFSGLHFDEASSLLLRATCLPTPWEPDWKSVASKITEALGFLALAIVQAGAAIRERLCSLHDYLGWYDRSWQTLRDDKVGRATNYERAVWTTFEVCYERLERGRDRREVADAMELLQLFAFLYRENLSPAILTRALKNAQLEAEQEAKSAEEEKSNPFRKQLSLGEKLQSKFASLVLAIIGMNTPTPLPSVLRDGRQAGGLELAEDRIRRALRELEKMSLIYFNEGNGTYTMHPVVHDWARKRPRMKLRHQALWADIAGHVLSASILLPPLGARSEDELHHATLLPHIEHVQKCRADIQAQFDRKPGRPWLSWLTKGTTTSRNMIHMFAKFSLVYAQCGQINEAEPLLTAVATSLNVYLGPESPRTRNAEMALSHIYWEQGHSDKALELQRSIAVTCEKHFGRGNPETLRALCNLSRTLGQQGKYSAARRLQIEVVNGLEKLLGPKHKDTLEAFDELGKTLKFFWRQEDLQESFNLSSKALEGMYEVFGSEHLRTTLAKENIARVSCLIGDPALLDLALQYMNEAIATRKARMGKEAAWTLMAMGNKAVVLSALGQLEEAERLMLRIIPIAARNLGADHIGVLFGRQVLATILIQQERYPEAESILLEVSECQKQMSSRRGNFHPDRIASLIELARCYQLQGKLQDSIAICDETIRGIEEISENRHPFIDILTLARSKMAELKEAQGGEYAFNISSAESVIMFPEHLFKLYR